MAGNRISWSVWSIGLVAVLAAGMFLAPALPARAATMDFKVDPAASRITATVAQPMAKVRGNVIANFKIISGDISGSRADIADTGKVTIVIDAASFKSGIGMRDRDVRDNYLNAARYPQITFASVPPLKNVAMTSPDSMTAEMSGNLTIRGVTRPVTMPITVALGKDGSLTADGKIDFNYTEFGIKAPVMLFMSAGKTALVAFHIVAEPVATPQGTAQPSASPSL